MKRTSLLTLAASAASVVVLATAPLAAQQPAQVDSSIVPYAKARR